MASYAFDDYKHKASVTTSISNSTSTFYPVGLTSNTSTSTTSFVRCQNVSFRGGNSVYASTGFFVDSAREKKTEIYDTCIDAVDLINEVNVVDFKYKIDPDVPKIGFIAEDTPSILSTPSEKNMDITNCIGVLLKAIQQLDARLRRLEE